MPKESDMNISAILYRRAIKFWMLASLLLSFIAIIACSAETAVVDGDVDGDEAIDGDLDAESDSEQDADPQPDGDLDDEFEAEAESETDALESEKDLDAESESETENEFGVGLPPRPDYAPSLLVKPEDKVVILERIEREPWSGILQQIKDRAGRAHVDLPPDTFDSAEQTNGETAQAAAFLAWLQDDAEMGAKAREFLQKLSDNYASHQDGDINIRLPSIAMGYTYALDLLIGAQMIPENEAKEAEDKLTTIIGAFYDDYILNSITRIFIYLTQNNHPIRTACSIAMVAMAFPEHPRAAEWANWAFYELDYLWGPTGQYVQADGGVSEGSLYYRFAFAPSLSLFLAYNNRVGEPRIFEKNCINRQDHEPWAGHGCIDGEPFVFESPIFEDRFQLSVDWFMTLRMPDSRRPPMEDSDPKESNGGAIMALFMDRPDLIWDWKDGGYNMDGGYDLRIQHLAYAPEWFEAEPPAWTHRVMPDAGQAVLRSGWGNDDLWMMMTSEHGSARMTVHDHIDGNSFTMSAYGDYLLIDTGYHKPNKANNALTAQAASHNVLMIEGEPVPRKGLLLNFGDADAFLKNEYLGSQLAYVEGWQPIDVSTTQRAMAMVRNRYGVIFDRIETTVTEPRLHTWRLHGLAGYDQGGLFEINEAHARWERTNAGMDVYLASSASDLSLIEPEHEVNMPPHVDTVNGGVKDHGVMDGVVTAITPRFAAVLAPYKVGADLESAEASLVVEALSGAPEGWAAWTVTGKDFRDLVLARDPESDQTVNIPDGPTISTDAEWVILSIDTSPTLALIARGTFLSMDETPVFENVTGDMAYLEGSSK
jgi:hypothetical protein